MVVVVVLLLLLLGGLWPWRAAVAYICSATSCVVRTTACCGLAMRRQRVWFAAPGTCGLPGSASCLQGRGPLQQRVPLARGQAVLRAGHQWWRHPRSCRPCRCCCCCCCCCFDRVSRCSWGARRC